MALPFAVVGMRFATGYRLGHAAGTTDIAAPVWALMLASFVLVPMLSLASTAGALAVFLGATLEANLVHWRVWRAVFLLCVAISALAAAYLYDVVVIPAIS